MKRFIFSLLFSVSILSCFTTEINLRAYNQNDYKKISALEYKLQTCESEKNDLLQTINSLIDQIEECKPETKTKIVYAGIGATSGFTLLSLISENGILRSALLFLIKKIVNKIRIKFKKPDHKIDPK